MARALENEIQSLLYSRHSLYPHGQEVWHPKRKIQQVQQIKDFLEKYNKFSDILHKDAFCQFCFREKLFYGRNYRSSAFLGRSFFRSFFRIFSIKALNHFYFPLFLSNFDQSAFWLVLCYSCFSLLNLLCDFLHHSTTKMSRPFLGYDKSLLIIRKHQYKALNVFLLN